MDQLQGYACYTDQVYLAGRIHFLCFVSDYALFSLYQFFGIKFHARRGGQGVCSTLQHEIIHILQARMQSFSTSQ